MEDGVVRALKRGKTEKEAESGQLGKAWPGSAGREGGKGTAADKQPESPGLPAPWPS